MILDNCCHLNNIEIVDSLDTRQDKRKQFDRVDDDDDDDVLLLLLLLPHGVVVLLDAAAREEEEGEGVQHSESLQCHVAGLHGCCCCLVQDARTLQGR